MKTLLTSLLILPCLFLLSACTSNPEPAQAPIEPEYTAIKFHKDTCGTCKKMDVFLPDVEQAVSKKVDFVTYDFTDDAAKAKTTQMAKDAGFEQAMADNQGSGFVLLVDKNGNPVGKFSGKTHDKEAMIAAITDAAK